MRWDESHESPDVIDRRGEAPERGGFRGGNPAGLLNLAFFLLSKPHGWVIVLIGAVVYFGRGFLLSGDDVAHRAQGEPAGNAGRPAETPEVHFVSFVLDDVQSSWEKKFAQLGRPYRHAKLVLYMDATR